VYLKHVRPTSGARSEEPGSLEGRGDRRPSRPDRPTPARGRPVAAAPLTPGLFCRWKIEASQGWNGRVSVALVIAAKCRRLGGPLSSGLEPLVSNHSLGVTSECGLLAFTPSRFSGMVCFAPPPDKGEAGRGYCSKLSDLCEKYPTPTLP